MQNLTPANGIDVATFKAEPKASILDLVMEEGHQIVEALRAQPAAAPVEKLDNTPSFQPTASGPRF